MSSQRTSGWDREITLVSQLAAAASLFAFLFYFRSHDLLLYGDAVAHINIARRVIDSRTPGLLQLGTVWLPLPHLLMIPFLFSDAAWETGIAGSLPSMCAYVLAAAGMFRLVRNCCQGLLFIRGRIAAWLAALAFAANPNLLYMQTTAMTEVLYLAFFIWAVVHFSDFVQSAGGDAQSSLSKSGLCLLGACLTRYDGWFLSAVMCAVAVITVVWQNRSAIRGGLVKFLLLAIAGPAIWLGYNAAVYRNPLEFANGPYSAQAIEQKTALSSSLPHPGWHNLPISFTYFLKAAEDNIAEGKLQKIWVILLAVGAAAIIILRRRSWPVLLLLLPLPFYSLSIAHGSVPIYLPEWWPFGYYNVRFGLEMLPAFAATSGVALYILMNFSSKRAPQAAMAALFFAFVAASVGLVWEAKPICYREAWVNSRARIAFETSLASTLVILPHDSTLLMYLGDHVGALQDAGIPLRRTINEGNHRPWEKPSDSQGLWERALSDPKQYADYVIAIDDDPVAQEVQRRDLSSMVVIRTIGQAPATIYWTHRDAGNQAR
jgi:hypothetical protein